MTRFTDYDEFLRNQASRQKVQQDELREKLKASRKELSPWINETYSLFKEYIETILVPRRDFLMIPKKRESLEKIDTTTDSNPYYIYRISLIPREILPGAFDPSDVIAKNHLSPNEITVNDWHFDCSLQFDLSLFDTFDRNGVLTGKLEPRIFLRTWGLIQNKRPMMINSRTEIKELKAWKLDYTEIVLRGSLQELQRDLENMFMLLTPRVLAHLEEVWKIKK